MAVILQPAKGKSAAGLGVYNSIALFKTVDLL
jgi:hypothetical protein